MAAAHRYDVELHGMRWASEVDLHLPRPAVAADPDLVLRLAEPQDVPDEPPAGELLAQLHREDGAPMYTFTRAEDGKVTLRFHGLCEFRLAADLRSAQCSLVPGRDPDFAAVLAGGMLATTVLVLRGHPVLHASAIEQDGGALAVVGASGMGKSTVSTLLCRTGGALITDDVLRVDRHDGGLVCRAGGAESRLRPSAAHLTDQSTRATADGRAAVPAGRLAADRVPLRVLMIPYPTRGLEQVRLERLPATKALVELLRFPRIVGWHEPTSTTRHFAHLAELVRSVPVLRAFLPWSERVGEPLAHELRRALVLADDAGAGWPGP